MQNRASRLQHSVSSEYSMPTTVSCYLGIDPGVRGAVALIDKSGTVLRVWDQPMIGRSEDCSQMLAIVSQVAPVCKLATVEKLFTGPMNRHAAGVLNRLSGIWIGLLVANNVPLVEVRPQEWQSVFIKGRKKGSKPSEEYFRVASLMYPHLHLTVDQSAAILMAEYTRRTTKETQ